MHQDKRTCYVVYDVAINSVDGKPYRVGDRRYYHVDCGDLQYPDNDTPTSTRVIAQYSKPVDVLCDSCGDWIG